MYIKSGLSLLFISGFLLTGCASPHSLKCEGSATITGDNHGNVQGEIGIHCTNDTRMQASIWDRFSNTLMAYSNHSISNIDFSKLTMMIGVAGGQVTTDTPQVTIKLFGEDQALLTQGKFDGILNNGTLKFKKPNDVKFWVQNFENDIAYFSVESDLLSINQTFDIITLNASAMFHNNELATARSVYESGGLCRTCNDFKEER